jgi:arylsulfatase
VVILTDDQGYGEVGRHGNPILRTPNLDRLHAESTRFTRFHVSPTCAPTRAALLTGRHEFRSGVSHTIFERERLSLKATTLPDRLRRLGYSTGVFGKWHLGDEDAYQPDRRGFDEVFIHGGGGIGQGYPGSCGDVPGNTYRDPWIRHNGTFVQTRGYCTDVFFDAATGWIDSRSGRGPFLAWLAPNAPHDPFVSPGPEWEAPYQGQGLSTNAVRYYAMIAHLDAAVGRLLDHLDRTGLSESTLVIFMTDNGHSVPSVYNAGMRGTKGTPYEGGVRVPSFWRWRGHIGPGLDCNRLTAHLDIFPTLLELAGDRAAGGVATDGRSLVPLLADPYSEWADRFLFLHFGRWETGSAHFAKHRRSAVMDSRYKLVEDRELFDLVEDPGEKVNRIAELPREALRLRKAYDRWWNEVLPETEENEWALGPYRNPFKSAFWDQQGGGPDPALLRLMDPAWKFDPDRPAF